MITVASAELPATNVDNTLITILLTLLVIALPAAVFFASTRANRQQAKAEKGAVDAAAYERARGIYEGAIRMLRQELGELREEIVSVREARDALAAEVSRLRQSNAQLTVEVADLANRLQGLKRNPPEPPWGSS